MDNGTVNAPAPLKAASHYPYALADFLKKRLAEAQTQDARQAVIERANRMMALPINQYRPLPQALRFHKSPKHFRWCLGGNRSSKSQSAAQEVAWWATGTHPWRKIKTPNSGWYATINWDLVGEILWPKLEGLLDGFNYRVVWHYKPKSIPDSVFIKVPGGESRVVFKSYEQGRETFQGTQRLYFAADEQFPEDIYQESITRIGPGDPLNFWGAFTPIEAQPWLEEKLSSKIPEHWDVFEFPIDDNRESRGGFIPDVAIDQAIEEWPEEMQATRRLGKWASFVGSVYRSFDRKIHVVDEVKERGLFFPSGKPLPDHRAIGGIDWGGNNPFVFLWGLYLPEHDCWYIYDEYYWDYRKRGSRLIRDHAKEILARTSMWGIPLIRTWSDHDVQDRHEIHAEGISSHPAKKEVRPGIEYVQSLFKIRQQTGRPRLFIASRCVNLIRETISLKWPKGSDFRDPTDEPVKKDDHAPDAMRYLLFSEHRAHSSGRLLEIKNTRNQF